MDNNVANFWARIAFLRKAKNLTNRQLADSIGIGESRLKSAATQKQKPSVMLAFSLAQQLGTSVEYLVTGQECSRGMALSSEALELAQMFDTLPAEARGTVMATTRLLTKGNR